MSDSRLSLLGLYKYDSTLFEQLSLPSGIDKDTLVNNILLNSSEFEVLYPEISLMKDAIGLWSSKWNRTFTKWIEALSIEYSPLENYDRQEDWTDNNTRTNTNTGTMHGTLSGTETNSASLNDSTSGNNTTNTNKSAFDSTSLQPYDQTVTNTTGTDTQTTSSNTSTGSTADQNTSNNTNETNNSTHSGRMHGNIGVTTSQQMLESELSIDEWNIYEHITDIFLQEFCILVY